MTSTFSQNRSKGMGKLHLMVIVFCLTNTHVDCETNCDSQTVQSQTPYARVDTTVYTYPSSSDAASIYVRWGRSNCTEKAQLIYSGITAGAPAFQKGGGGNFLCLPDNPVYTTTEAGENNDRSKIRSTQMYGAGFPPFQPFSDNREDVACSVCRSPRRSTVLMIPGRNVCPSEDWTLEYEGYLAAPRITIERAEFICVDGTPEGYPGTEGHNPGPSELHPVESICGDLPCPPYVNGYELTCAVCTM